MTLKQKISGTKKVLGSFIPAPSPELVEIASYSGFDFVVIDAEHGPLGPAEVTHMIRAAQASDISVLVRVPLATKDYILRSLDAGANGIVIPQIETKEQAIQAVRECKYPPEGVRGAAFYARAHGFTRDAGWSALERSNRNVVVGLMIESPKGMENLADILEVPGIDFILYGPSDMSVWLGKSDDGVAALQRCYKEVISKSSQSSVPVGIPAPSSEQARSHFQAGYRIVVAGLLPMLLGQATRFVSETLQD